MCINNKQVHIQSILYTTYFLKAFKEEKIQKLEPSCKSKKLFWQIVDTQQLLPFANLPEKITITDELQLIIFTFH